MIVDSELSPEEVNCLEILIKEYIDTNKIYIRASISRGSIMDSIAAAIKHGWKENNKFNKQNKVIKNDE